MIKLYHGSYISVSNPLAKIGRKNLDFGPGFYLTKIESQAKDWALTIAGRRGRNAIKSAFLTKRLLTSIYRLLKV